MVLLWRVVKVAKHTIFNTNLALKNAFVLTWVQKTLIHTTGKCIRYFSSRAKSFVSDLGLFWLCFGCPRATLTRTKTLKNSSTLAFWQVLDLLCYIEELANSLIFHWKSTCIALLNWTELVFYVKQESNVHARNCMSHDHGAGPHFRARKLHCRYMHRDRRPIGSLPDSGFPSRQRCVAGFTIKEKPVSVFAFIFFQSLIEKKSSQNVWTWKGR
jgi:hypothetical protein